MTHHIVVLGAGYAGLVAAKLAARQKGTRVTLVNRRDHFVERVRLHQLVTGQRLRDLPLADLLAGTGVELVVDTVTGIDADTRTVRPAHAPEIGYDTLVYALGSQADLSPVPGAAEHAHTVATLDQAERLRTRLRDGGTAVVVGGGLTGIETAAELAECLPEVKVRLVTEGALGGALSRRAQRHLNAAFGRLAVEVREHARVAGVHDDHVTLEGGERLGADVTIWTTGFRVPELARQAGFSVDDDGRMLVDPTLRSVSHREVYGIGDAAAVRTADGVELRMACATALPVAQQAVRAITARLAGRTPDPVRFRYANQCVSLGRRDGLIQFVRGDDSPVEMVLTGRTAVAYKETIVKGTVMALRHPWMPTRMPGR
ncbi:NAD(P)/FAD-dependent oxidoreductase [Streptosporangium sp. NPDC049376]|uniref:NAD(P)/FAD-dependent oxidoreductase n=1 Tax=Streptosporangium sp. NPDC049376 TaxID=3366192 RepID=UPI00379FAA11